MTEPKAPREGEPMNVLRRLARYILRDELDQWRDAVIWMSGSSDFGPAGPARAHWCRIRDTLLP